MPFHIVRKPKTPPPPDLKAAPSVEDFDLGEASEVDDEESQLKAFVGLPGSSGHNRKEAKPEPKAKLSKWEEASQISKETATEQLQQKAIRFMVDFFKFSPTPNRCELFLRTPNHLQATVFVNELGKEYTVPCRA